MTVTERTWGFNPFHPWEQKGAGTDFVHLHRTAPSEDVEQQFWVLEKLGGCV